MRVKSARRCLGADTHHFLASCILCFLLQVFLWLVGVSPWLCLVVVVWRGPRTWWAPVELRCAG